MTRAGGFALMRAIDALDASMVARELNGASAGLVNMTDVRGRTPLMGAARRGATDVARALLDAGADASMIDIAGRSAMPVAAASGAVGVVSLLAASGVDVDFKDNSGSTALMEAAGGGHAAVVTALLEADADKAGAWFRSPLMIGSYNGMLEAVDALLAGGADPNLHGKNNDTVLIAAVAGGHPMILSSLLTAGARVNEQRVDGATALGKASLAGVR